MSQDNEKLPTGENAEFQNNLDNRHNILAVIAVNRVVDFAKVDFYSIDRSNEAERLKTMAEMADPISKSLIENGLTYDDTVVDVGAGDSTSLGQTLSEKGIKYIPIDQRQGSIDKQKAAGFNAVQSSASDLRLPSMVAEAVHSRFTLSWLDSNQRIDAYSEMARITKPNGKIIIIDYNWSDIAGPKVLVEAAQFAVNLLNGVGFDPDFGSKIADDFTEKKAQIEKKTGKKLTLIDEYRAPIYEGILGECLPIFEQTATSILDFLSDIGDYVSHDQLNGYLDRLRKFTIENPNEQARLADVVGRVIKVESISDKEAESVEVYEKIENNAQEILILGLDYECIFSNTNEILKNTVKLTSEKAIKAARKLQGLSYVHHGLVEKNALKEDGTLSNVIDPNDQVERSEYIATLGETGNILACVRLIKTGQHKKISVLPTVNRLGEDVFFEHGINNENSDKVLEVSALSSDIKYGNFDTVIKTVLGLMVYAKRNGYEGAVMELRNDKVKVFQTLLGESNLVMIDESLDDNHTIKIDGVSQSTKYSCMVGHPNIFCNQVKDYIDSKFAESDLLGKKRSRLLQMILDSLIDE